MTDDPADPNQLSLIVDGELHFTLRAEALFIGVDQSVLERFYHQQGSRTAPWPPEWTHATRQRYQEGAAHKGIENPVHAFDYWARKQGLTIVVRGGDMFLEPL